MGSGGGEAWIASNNRCNVFWNDYVWLYQNIVHVSGMFNKTLA